MFSFRQCLDVRNPTGKVLSFTVADGKWVPSTDYVDRTCEAVCNIPGPYRTVPVATRRLFKALDWTSGTRRITEKFCHRVPDGKSFQYCYPTGT